MCVTFYNVCNVENRTESDEVRRDYGICVCRLPQITQWGQHGVND